MTSHTTTMYLDLSIGGHECSREVEVGYEHHRASGDGWHEPRYPERCVLESAVVAGIDLYPLLTQGQIDAIESDLLSDWRDAREQAREDAAERRAEMMREEA